MATVAFCGLGQMGAPMAARVLDGPDELVVWNRTAERAADLVDAGARSAGTPAEAAAGADAVVTMLSGPDALEAVVFGPGGVAAGVAEGATVIEMSTVGPAAVRTMAERLPVGVEVLDAPVLGSVPQATEGTLKIFAGGEAQLVERWRPLLERMGQVTHLGPLGAGASMKLVTNSVLGALMTALAEALALADSFGLDQAVVLDILAESPIGATVRSKRGHIESGEYPPNFKLSLAVKDLGLVNAAAAEAGLELRLAPAARAWLERADQAGLGDADYSAVIAAVRGR
jgi:3-hydroxyisobutyrate dehydrogenase-like beta-hydroxyacid dehydrogenase